MTDKNPNEVQMIEERRNNTILKRCSKKHVRTFKIGYWFQTFSKKDNILGENLFWIKKKQISGI